MYVVKSQEEPTLRFYKNSGNDVITASSEAPEESGYSAYTCYNLPLTANGTGNASFELTAATGESVTVKIDGTETAEDAAGKRYLELGGHTLTLW